MVNKTLSSAPHRLPRILGLMLIPFLATGFAGCSGSLDTGYSLDLIYPARKDPLVLAPLPDAQPSNPIPPGKLDESIRKLPEVNGKILDPTQVSAENREALRLALVAAFGKPAEPKVAVVGTVEDEELAEIVAGAPQFLKDLKLDDAGHLAAGGKLFRRHCMQCHGVGGDGRGPTGPWLSPAPRDFRQGVFKFISCSPTLNRLRPRRDDIKRTLLHGIEGTSMASYTLLPDAELEQLVSYIIHLSIRGEVEYDTLKTLLDPNLGVDALTDRKIDRHVAGRTGLFLWQWSEATKQAGATPQEAPRATDPADADFASSVRRGYAVFTGQDAGCIACHQDFGRQARFRYDDWGTLVRPNNLTRGSYRGGRRPIDFYYRLRCGIPGANMPRIDSNNFPDADVWAMINFLRALPHPEQLPEDIRAKVYGPVDPLSARTSEGGHE